MKLVVEEDRSIASLRTNEPKFSNIQQFLPKQKIAKTTKKNVEESRSLQEILRKCKAQKLVKNFVQKMSRNVPSHHLPDDPLVASEWKEQTWISKLVDKLEQIQGIAVNPILMMIWSFVKMILTLILIFILTVFLAFPQTEDFQSFFYFRILTISLFCLDFVLNLIVQKYFKGKELKNLKEIGEFYLKHQFLIDILTIVLASMDFIFHFYVLFFILLALFKKFHNNIRQFERYEYLYLTTNTKERYYKVFKVFFTNFIIGHFLSILLNLMVYLNSQDNWHIKNGIANSKWIQKYIWGYYWGTNIMLTVGFGDLSATNYLEALILIFIETFSCITLAYNISAVGSIISELQNSEQEKNKLLKTFKHMLIENELSSELETRIVNFIRESFQIKQAFLYDEYEALIEKLPPALKSEYQKQANKSLFENIPFINLLSRKSLSNLAEKVNQKIAHPEEIIRKKGQFIDFLILEKGEVDFVCRNCSTKLNGKSLKKIKIKTGQKAQLLSLGFIKNKKFKFDIKSLDYSVLYNLSRGEFQDCLKGSEFDYQLWCSAKDKNEYLLGQNEIHECEVCKKGEKHSLVDCPKLHYIPLKQHILNKHLNEVKKQKSSRKRIMRRKPNQQIMKKMRSVTTENEFYLLENYGQYYIEDIKKYKKIFHKIKGEIKKIKTKKHLERAPSVKFASQKLTCQLDENFNDYDNCAPQEYYFSFKTDEKISGKNFWEIQCDKAYNFEHYLRNYNPDNIDVGFLPHNEFVQI